MSETLLQKSYRLQIDEGLASIAPHLDDHGIITCFYLQQSSARGLKEISSRLTFKTSAYLEVTSQLQSQNLVKAINMIEANRAGNANVRTTRGFAQGVCYSLNINLTQCIMH